MEKREVIMVLVIVGIFLLLNKPYTGYQFLPISAEGSGKKTFLNPIETGDSGEKRIFVVNPTDTGPDYYKGGWSKKCSGDEDCPKSFYCKKHSQFSGYCVPR